MNRRMCRWVECWRCCDLARCGRGRVEYLCHENGAWWYDPENKADFEHALNRPADQEPWGHDAAIVYFYGCGGCGDERRFVGYYFKLGPEAQRR